MILFRVDGNRFIGAGHIMRCLSIADAARRAGENCIFVVACNDFEKTILSHGYKVEVLNTDYQSMKSELERFSCILYLYRPKTVIVDSYYVDNIYLLRLWEAVRQVQSKLVFIDDLMMFPYSCDMLLNYNIYAIRARYITLYRGKQQPKFLLGTSYVPLRSEFQFLRERVVKERALNILISTGGTDFKHMAIYFIQEAKKYSGYTFHIVVGVLNKDHSDIRLLSKNVKNVILYENINTMSELMSRCDIAISAAGSTLYELCATQTPTITYVVADNQIPGAEEFENHRMMKNGGDVRSLGNEKLVHKLMEEALRLSDDYEERCQMAVKMRAVSDGRGAERIIKALNSLNL